MRTIGATKTGIDALGRAPAPSRTPKRDEIDVANTLRLPKYSNSTKPEGALRDASERDDRQVLSAATVLDAQLNYDTRASSNKRVRSDAGRSVPALAGTSCPVLDFSSLDRATGENMAIAKNAAIS